MDSGSAQTIEVLSAVQAKVMADHSVKQNMGLFIA
jgi:hypothetical protein